MCCRQRTYRCRQRLHPRHSRRRRFHDYRFWRPRRRRSRQCTGCAQSTGVSGLAISRTPTSVAPIDLITSRQGSACRAIPQAHRRASELHGRSVPAVGWRKAHGDVPAHARMNRWPFGRLRQWLDRNPGERAEAGRGQNDARRWTTEGCTREWERQHQPTQHLIDNEPDNRNPRTITVKTTGRGARQAAC